MRVFSLSVHADYACAHSGACCTAGWAIPVESSKQRLLGTTLLVPGHAGACRFFDPTTHLCVVHRDHGEAALPDACRQFPRLALLDDRGVHVSLSHFCPTAARLLFRADVALTIVESPIGFPAGREYEGLDARGTWPPLIRPTLLFGLDGYTAWERFVVSAFATGPSDSALGQIAYAAETLRTWSPADGPIASVLEECGPPTAEQRLAALNLFEAVRANAFEIVFEAIPEQLRASARDGCTTERSPYQPPPTGLRGTGANVGGFSDDHVVCRYLAAKAFASWTAYQADDVRTLVAELVLADVLVGHLRTTRPLVEAIREADRLLVHLADRPSLVSRLARVEPHARTTSGLKMYRSDTRRRTI